MSKPGYDFNKYIFKYIGDSGASISIQLEEPLSILKTKLKGIQVKAVFAEAASDTSHEIALVPSSIKGLIYFGPEFDVGQVHFEKGVAGLTVVDDGRISTDCDFSGEYKLASVYAPDHLAQTEDHEALVRKLGRKVVYDLQYL